MVDEQAPAEGGLSQALRNGEITLRGQFTLGSNYTFLVSVQHQGSGFPAVYKPMRGEQPLWDFPSASLARREVAAWLVSEALGWGLVPCTVLREGPFGPGSLQQFIEYDPRRHYFTFRPTQRQRLRPVAAFDLLVNNADRKGSHVLFEKRTRHLYAIDHGLCFHAEDKLRTVIWDFAGEIFPEDVRLGLESLHSRRNALFAQMEEHLAPQEIEAFDARLEGLLNHPEYPPPPEDRRAFPYPPL